MFFMWAFILLCLLKDNLAVNGDPNCPDVDGENITLFPNEENCTQFYKCARGIAYLYNCSVGLHFNPSLNVCDSPQNAGCNASISTNTPSYSLPATFTTPKPSNDSTNGDPNCPDTDDEYVTLFPNTKNCSQFYKCSEGIAYLYNCSDGLHFNPSINSCDFPQNAGCNDSIPTNSTTNPPLTSNSVTSTTPKPTTGSTSKDLNCPDTDGEYVTLFPNKKNCSQFYKCSGGVAYLYNCSDGLHFNPSINSCDFPQNAGCNDSIPSNTTSNPPSTSSSVTSTSSKPTTGSTSKDPICPDTDGEYVTLFPNKKNCSQFYKCSEGEAYLYNCSVGLHFNPTLNSCDFPQNAGCNTSIPTNTTTNPPSTPSSVTSNTPNDTTESTSEDPDCPDTDGEFVTLFPNKKNCSQFYVCSKGVAYLYNCSAGLDFNPSLSVCDFPQNAGCNTSNSTYSTTNSTSTPTPVTSTTPKPTTESTNKGPNCPIPDGKYVTFFPHETNCSQFYKCSNGRAYLYDCPASLHFNPVLNVCDWPQDAGCGSIPSK